MEVMEEEVKQEDYVLQYYTIVGNQDVLLQETEDEQVAYYEDEETEEEEENQVMYIAVSQEGEDETNDSNSNTIVEVKEPLPVIYPNISNMLITIQDGQFYLTQNVSSDDNLQSTQAELVNTSVQEEEKTSVTESNVTSDFNEINNETYEESNYQEIQLEDGSCAIIDSNLLNSIIGKSNIEINEASNEMTNEEEEKGKKWSRKWICQYPDCGKIYSTSHHLAVHNRTHTGSRPFKCIHCEKSFTTGYSLKAHLRIHTGEKPYPCKVCPKQFKTSGDLQKHNRIHTGEKPFLCPVKGCGKSFTTSNIRKVHIRSHTGERPYACSTCGKAFASATNYKNHVRIHSGEKPYVCNVEGCGKRFTEYSSLYKHNFVHQQTRPFACSYCPVFFKQESSLKSHKIGEHGIIFGQDGSEIVMVSKEDESDFQFDLSSQSSSSLLEKDNEDDPDDFYN